MKLTDAVAIRLTLASGETERIEWDDDLPGFGIRLRRNEAGRITRRFVCQYRPAPRRTRRMTLKGTPGVVRTAAARKWAAGILANVHLNADPQAARIAARRAVTFGARAEQYLHEVVALRRSATQDAYRRHLTVHARTLHNRPVETITRGEIAALLSHAARVTGMVQSNRLRATLSAFFAWCMLEHELLANPVIGTRMLPETSRERVLSEQELVAIWRASDSGSDFDRIVRLLMLTACRRTEIGDMRWSELSNGVFTLPAARAKNHLTHTVALHWLAIAQLPPRRTVGSTGAAVGRDAVFGTGEGGFRGWSRCKARLDAQLSFTQPWTLHDLRRTCATWLAEHGTEPPHIDAVLNHASGVARSGVRGIYNRANYEGPKQAALTRWAEHIAGATGQRTDGIVAVFGRAV
jgi:integrase